MPQVQQKTVFDTGRQYLGSVYAKALLGVSEKSGTSEAVLVQLDSLVRDVLDRLPELEAVLGSPRVPHEDKERMLDRAFGDKMSRELLNFLKVLSRRGRFDCVRAVNQAARKLFCQMRGRREVQLCTAEPLDADLYELIANRLRQALGSDVDVTTSVDPQLIGGMVVRVGDTVYDGSLANRLTRLRDEMVAKTADRIRGGPERFATAEDG